MNELTIDMSRPVSSAFSKQTPLDCGKKPEKSALDRFVWLATRTVAPSVPANEHARHAWQSSGATRWQSLCGRLAPKEFGELHEGYGLSDCPACVFLQARLARKHAQQVADHDAQLAAQLPTLRPAPLAACQSGHQ